MKSSREFTDSVFSKFEAAKKAEIRESVWKKKTIKYVSTLAACIVIAIGIIGINAGKTPDMPGVNTGNDPAVSQPAEPGGQGTDALEGGGENISDESTPTAAPKTAENPDYVAAVGTLEGAGVVSVIIAAGCFGVSYYRKRRKY